MTSKELSQDDINLAVRLSLIEERAHSIDRQMVQAAKDLADIKNLVMFAKGGWKFFLFLSGAFAGLMEIGIRFFDSFFHK